jgi:hypothetical protein
VTTADLHIVLFLESNWSPKWPSRYDHLMQSAGDLHVFRPGQHLCVLQCRPNAALARVHFVCADLAFRSTCLNDLGWRRTAFSNPTIS